MLYYGHRFGNSDQRLPITLSAKQFKKDFKMANFTPKSEAELAKQYAESSSGGSKFVKAPTGILSAKIVKAVNGVGFKDPSKAQLKVSFEVTGAVANVEDGAEVVGTVFDWLFTEVKPDTKNASKIIDANMTELWHLANKLGINPERIWEVEDMTQKQVFAIWAAEATKLVGYDKQKDVVVERYSNKEYINNRLFLGGVEQSSTSPAADDSDY
jgi:hypothetical protein